MLRIAAHHSPEWYSMCNCVCVCFSVYVLSVWGVYVCVIQCEIVFLVATLAVERRRGDIGKVEGYSLFIFPIYKYIRAQYSKLLRLATKCSFHSTRELVMLRKLPANMMAARILKTFGRTELARLCNRKTHTHRSNE